MREIFMEEIEMFRIGSKGRDAEVGISAGLGFQYGRGE